MEQKSNVLNINTGLSRNCAIMVFKWCRTDRGPHNIYKEKSTQVIKSVSSFNKKNYSIKKNCIFFISYFCQFRKYRSQTPLKSKDNLGKKYVRKKRKPWVRLKETYPAACVSGPFWGRLTHFIIIILHPFPFLWW